MSADRAQGARFNPWKQFRGLLIPDPIMASQLSLGAKVRYAILARFAGKRGYCFPTMETIGRRMGVSSRQARNDVAELVRTGYICRERRDNRRPNRYYFLWHASLETHDGKNSSSLRGTILPTEQSHLREESELPDLDSLPARRKKRDAQAEPLRRLPDKLWGALAQVVRRLLEREPTRSALGRMISATPMKREAEALEAIEDAERRGYGAGSRCAPRSVSWFVSVIRNYWADRERQMLPPATAGYGVDLKACEQAVGSFDTLDAAHVNAESKRDEAGKGVTSASGL